MSRYPPLAPSDLNEEQKNTYDQTSATCEALFGPSWLYKDGDKFVGPFAPIMYTPSLMQPYVQIAVELGKFSIPAAARETAILATGSTFQAAFELYAHGRLATLKNVLSTAQIESIKRGVKPSDLTEDCVVAFDIAIELSTSRGPLKEESFQRLVKAFGRINALALIHYVGVYAYTCILLNGVAAGVPAVEL